MHDTNGSGWVIKRGMAYFILKKKTTKQKPNQPNPQCKVGKVSLKNKHQCLNSGNYPVIKSSISYFKKQGKCCTMGQGNNALRFTAKRKNRQPSLLSIQKLANSFYVSSRLADNSKCLYLLRILSYIQYEQNQKQQVDLHFYSFQSVWLQNYNRHFQELDSINFVVC